MHMADALLSPAVGGTMWAIAAGTIASCSKKVRAEFDGHNVPLMGVLGAFLFAAQMINFTIPATGSSGHLVGGLLLTILLGPPAAFLVIASVLVVQALFFADGGLLALGCNIVNMGFIPAFIVYPLVYRNLLGTHPSLRRRTVAIMVSALVSLQLGSFGVVLETCFSGIAALPCATFTLLMQPIHLAIGIIEGAATLAVVTFIRQARPEILAPAPEARPRDGFPARSVVVTLLVLAILTGGVLSRFASGNPDGLEWAIARATGKGELNGPEQGVHGVLARTQETTSFLPAYTFRKPAAAPPAGTNIGGGGNREEEKGADTGIAGVVGSLLTLVLVFVAGFVLKRRNQTAGLSL